MKTIDSIAKGHFIPLLPIRDMIVFPHMVVSLVVGRESSIQAVEAALEDENIIFLACQKDSTIDTPSKEDIYQSGTIATIIRMSTISEGKIKILVQGIVRAKVEKYKSIKPFFMVKTENITSKVEEDKLLLSAKTRALKERLERATDLDKNLIQNLLPLVEEVDDSGKIVDVIAGNLGLKLEIAQELIELESESERLDKLLVLINNEIVISELKSQIFSDTKGQIDRGQRNFFLKEQLKVIKRELGEEEVHLRESDEYKKKIRKAKMPKDVKKEAEKQLDRLTNMHQDSPEANIVRTYLDLLTDLPWSISTDDNLDIKNASKILEEDHYGLDEIKERVLDFLAIRSLNSSMKAPILCLVGPPGVGKTSLGRSVAAAMGRKFLSISFGGVRDEAEIRGHRRTYVGAMPGRIIQGLNTVGSSNPVFILDEIDKLGSDFKGDPSAALLEVLDPVQNKNFIDHYLALPFDLSKVLFITTANILDAIPLPLQDRMEIIHIPGYTEEEKVIIAEKYIIASAIKENGLTSKQISFDKHSIMKLISAYTRESGLRHLEQVINKLCRKVGRGIVEKKYSKFKVTEKNLSDLLGPDKYMKEDELTSSDIGVATGLAWTPVGGEVLFVECARYEGNGNLIVTGMLGDVMKESSKAALSFIKTVASDYNIDSKSFTEYDYHIHVPAGAIPKDGPSAGITIATALLSILTSKKVRHAVAMTGEITITGRVLPIGGLKEKLLAAKRIGATTVIIPKKNARDLLKLPAYVTKSMKLIEVSTFKEVAKHAIVGL